MCLRLEVRAAKQRAILRRAEAELKAWRLEQAKRINADAMTTSGVVVKRAKKEPMSEEEADKSKENKPESSSEEEPDETEGEEHKGSDVSSTSSGSDGNAPCGSNDNPYAAAANLDSGSACTDSSDERSDAGDEGMPPLLPVAVLTADIAPPPPPAPSAVAPMAPLPPLPAAVLAADVGPPPPPAPPAVAPMAPSRGCPPGYCINGDRAPKCKFGRKLRLGQSLKGCPRVRTCPAGRFLATRPTARSRT